MRIQKILIPVAGVVLVTIAYRAYGWAGVALAAAGMVMWMLLHFTRMMKVMSDAANRPKGYVDSAVMLNAKLKAGFNLLHVIAMTKSLGELLSAPDQQPELFRWADGGNTHVTCEFLNGKLVKWTMVRPDPDGHAVSPNAKP
jgi:endo-1,4-beta-D-glucanase Y